MRKSAQNSSSNGAPYAAILGTPHGELNVSLEVVTYSSLIIATEDAQVGNKKIY